MHVPIEVCIGFPDRTEKTSPAIEPSPLEHIGPNEYPYKPKNSFWRRSSPAFDNSVFGSVCRVHDHFVKMLIKGYD